MASNEIGLGIKFKDLMPLQKAFINENIYKFRMEVIMVDSYTIEDIKNLFGGIHYFIVVKNNIFFVFYRTSALSKLGFIFRNALSIKIEKADKFSILRFLGDDVNEKNIVFDRKVIEAYLLNIKPQPQPQPQSNV